ncbi:MAG: DUF928 domain-containing protein [Cyanobacteria bacterium J06648_1]
MFKLIRLPKIAVIWGLYLFVFACWSDRAIAESSERLSDIQFVPPKEGEEPETRGAGTRDRDRLRCAAEESPIEAIMPEGNYGLTTQARPSIFIYLPETSARQVVISFESVDRQHYEVAFLPVEQRSQIVSFALPPDTSPLQVGKNYEWKLTLVCGDTPHVDDPILSGWIKRKTLSSDTVNLNLLSADELAAWYGNNGYWYDLLQQLELTTNKEQSVDEILWHLKDKY